MFFWKLTTEHIGIWVGSLVTSSKDIAENTQETFDWDSSVVKTYLGYLCFIFHQNWTRLLNGRTVSSSKTIRSLATIRTATMYLSAGRQSRSTVRRPIWLIKVKTKGED